MVMMIITISVTTLNSPAGGTEPGICLNFQGSYCLKIKQHFVYLAK